MKQLEAVIFDWAGTTVDYGCMAPILAMKHAFLQQELSVTLAEIREPMGMLKIDHIKAILNMDRVKLDFNQKYGRNVEYHEIQKIYDQFEMHIFSMLHEHTEIIPGVLDVQAYLRNHHIKIGSTTGFTKKMIDIVAESAKDQGYAPDFIISADEVKRGRPYPYMLHQNLAALDIMDTRSVMKIGDTIVDIQEGLYAGCWSIGVVKGSSMLGLSKSEIDNMQSSELDQRVQQVKYQMLNAGAHYVIDSIVELPLIIELINTGNTYVA
jgi:phosphonoacetaldehyde hydrolase